MFQKQGGNFSFEKKMLDLLSFLVLLYVSGHFKHKKIKKNSHQTDRKFLTHHQFTLFFFTFYRRPFRTLGWPWGHEFRLLGAIGVLWHPLWAGFITALRFFKLTGQMAGHPWLARIYYCLQMAGHKPSASALLYKPYVARWSWQRADTVCFHTWE